MTPAGSLCVMFMLVVTRLMSVTSDDVTLQRRTDDASIEDLMTLVQQQGSVIARQEASMQAMLAQITSQEAQITSLQSTVASLTTSLSHVTSRIVQVSFMAQTTPTPISFSASGSPLKFDKVITNLGGGYHPTSGVFIAPVTGLYVFYVQLMKNANEHLFHYVIELEGSEVCQNSLDEPLTYDKSSCLTTVHVQSGQQVFVRHKYGSGLVLEGNLWCSFAGFLLSAD